MNDVFVMYFIDVYHIAGNFKKRKLSRTSLFSAYSESFLRDCLTVRWIVGGMSKQSMKVLSAKSDFLPTCESFLPQKIPAIWYLLCPIIKEGSALN